MEEILIEEYNYPLPDERIAKYPLAERDQSKLLVYRNGDVSEDMFYDVGKYLPAGALLIYNNTRVIQARLEFHKLYEDGTQGARIEIFCLEPLEPHDYQLSLGATDGCTWKCMIGNAKKWKSGVLALPVILPTGERITLYAERGEQAGNTFAVKFYWDSVISFAEILENVGELPIPPYLNRKTEESDKTTYQTVYSRIKGSVAAPTAGLHFTDHVLNGLHERGVKTAEVTLHVGAGTFQPVKVADANQHTMHTEIIAVPRETITALIDNVGKIVAVGTTSMRTLESLYFIGSRLFNVVQDGSSLFKVAQFEPYEREYTLSTQEALQAIVNYLDSTGQSV